MGQETSRLLPVRTFPEPWREINGGGREGDRGESPAVGRGNRTAGGGTAYEMMHSHDSSRLLTPRSSCPVCLRDFVSLRVLFLQPASSPKSLPLPFPIPYTCVPSPWWAPLLSSACHGTVLNERGRMEGRKTVHSSWCQTVGPFSVSLYWSGFSPVPIISCVTVAFCPCSLPPPLLPFLF